MKLTNENAFVKIVPVDSGTDSKGKTQISLQKLTRSIKMSDIMIV
jgi:hypothetical protein